MDPPIAAILLSAGRSERMGAFKPLLPFGPHTVLEACVDYLLPVLEPIVVVIGPGRHELRTKLQAKPVIIVENPDPASEMGQSIACGVRALPAGTEAVVIALVDHPAIPSHVVQRLIDEWKSGARLVVPTWQGRGGHPVLVDLQFRAELLALPTETGLKSLFQTYAPEVRRVPVDSPFIARDMDTWDDYTRLYLDVFGERPPNNEESNESPGPAI